MTTDDRPLYVCVLCGELIVGYGHNPEPLASYDDGRCCDLCNDTKAIPARLAHLLGKTPITNVISSGGWVMLLHERASDGDRSLTGKYLKSYDPDAYDGHGAAEWTEVLGEAMHFASATDVLMFWRQESKVKPRRADGRPNRPLTAYTVEPRNMSGHA
jgi:hypothetical protein